jgi:hypothetical protein
MAIRPITGNSFISNGADRGVFNQMVMSFQEFKGALYIGSGIQNGGIDLVNKIGPAAPELIRFYPDGDWEVVVGAPRGSKSATSGYLPGFGNAFNGYFWRMMAHDGWLYLGTFDWSLMLYFANQQLWAERFRQYRPSRRTRSDHGTPGRWRSLS